jgi:hypothetical protein
MHHGPGGFLIFKKKKSVPDDSSGGKARPACKDGNLTAIYEPTV